MNVGPTRSSNNLLVLSSRPTALAIPVRLSDPVEARSIRPGASIRGSRGDAVARGLVRGIRAYLGIHARPSRASEAEQTSSPISGRLTTEVFGHVEGAGARVALTFDDCNNSAAWARKLDELAAAGAK